MDRQNLGHWKQYFESRFDRTREGAFGGTRRRGDTIEALIRENLKLAEKLLFEHIGESHYELSVWTDSDEPKIVAYYDSTSAMRPRTDPKRDKNPNFYRDNDYAVVPLLDAPTSEIKYVQRTSPTNYKHSSAKQKQAIKSSFLYCFDAGRPAALVGTCDRPGVFGREDQVLATLIRTIGLAIHTDLELAAKLSGSRSATTRPDNFVYYWIHVSDIHFGAPSVSHRFEQQQICAALTRDVAANAPKRADAIFVTGDVSFRAAKPEFDAAATWIKELARHADVASEFVYLVPGNHDVDRSTAAEPLVSSLHLQGRRGHRELDELLADEKSRKELALKLKRYQEFVRKHFREHPGQAGLDWRTTVERNAADEAKLQIRIAGLSSVWVSDRLDGRDSNATSFVPNMVVARSQLESLLSHPQRKELTILLSHHPTEWMVSDCQGLVDAYLRGRPHIHLCGHIHRKGASATHRFGESNGTLRFVAGATCNEDNPGAPSEHGYAWGAIRFRDSHWEVGWSPRVYVAELDAMRPDRTRFDLDELGFAWREIILK